MKNQRRYQFLGALAAIGLAVGITPAGAQTSHTEEAVKILRVAPVTKVRLPGEIAAPPRVRERIRDHRDLIRTKEEPRESRRDVADEDHRDEHGVCTAGNPHLLNVGCSESSQCEWTARCVGVPGVCRNTGTPCTSKAECVVPGVCSAGAESLRAHHRVARVHPPAPTSIVKHELNQHPRIWEPVPATGVR